MALAAARLPLPATLPAGQIVPSTHFLIGPVAALLVVGVLALVLRWIYAPSGDRAAPSVRRRAGDFGLLAPATITATRVEADELRQLLAAHRIRATVVAGGSVQGPDGPVADPVATAGFSVLVFSDDRERARALLSSAG